MPSVSGMKVRRIFTILCSLPKWNFQLLTTTIFCNFIQLLYVTTVATEYLVEQTVSVVDVRTQHLPRQRKTVNGTKFTLQKITKGTPFLPYSIN